MMTTIKQFKYVPVSIIIRAFLESLPPKRRNKTVMELMDTKVKGELKESSIKCPRSGIEFTFFYGNGELIVSADNVEEARTFETFTVNGVDRSYWEV